MAFDDQPLEMAIGLNVLNHLGLQLYSNIPAVVSEIVANAWDADATTVDITIDRKGETITVADNGHGMRRGEVNGRFLYVGYQRRLEQTGSTPLHQRHPMGRKGIGKLSIFSIAEDVEIYTCDGKSSCAFRMTLAGIREAIDQRYGRYLPEELEWTPPPNAKGTIIVLKKLRRKIYDNDGPLRRRLARRFSVIGPSNKFEVRVNNEPLSAEDRAYYHKAQFVWVFGPRHNEFARLFSKAQRVEVLSSDLFAQEASGWIATAFDTRALRDDDGNSINSLVVMMRGKLAQEDILDEIGDTGVYTKYLFGEVFADYLDLDDREDIATSSRQRLIEDDPRYIELKALIRSLLRDIRPQWSSLRGEEGLKRAQELPQVREWYQSLDGPAQVVAKQFLGKIHRLPIDDEGERRRLIKHSVLAFETLRYSQKLNALERIEDNNVEALVEIFRDLDAIEASMYYQIIKERIAVIQALQEKVDKSAKERAIQEHVFNHLWLLDPGWDRATDPEPLMEKRFAAMFTTPKGEATLTGEELKARYDIKYRSTYGRHVVIELKRADRLLTIDQVLPQVRKYHSAMRKMLHAAGKSSEPFEIVVILGKPMPSWSDAERAKSKRINSLP